jgi:hypothetical protein
MIKPLTKLKLTKPNHPSLSKPPRNLTKQAYHIFTIFTNLFLPVLGREKNERLNGAAGR